MANCSPPPLELRTAYTQKGLGIGGGAFLGLALFGNPYAAIAGAFVGWLVGNKVAIAEEKKFIQSCTEGKDT